jgi:hypothetical protein
MFYVLENVRRKEEKKKRLKRKKIELFLGFSGVFSSKLVVYVDQIVCAFHDIVDRSFRVVILLAMCSMA